MNAETRDPTSREAYPRLGTRGETYVGLNRGAWRDAYHWLLVMPNWAFVAVLAAAFVGLNAIFAELYVIDPSGIGGARPGSFADAFFFSAQTLSSVGYGAVWPRSGWANGVATVEMFVGMFNLGVAAGLVFARISRPTARIMFSDRAVVTEFEGVPTLMFRAANQRRNLVVEAEVTVTLVHDVINREGVELRRFEDLTVLRSRTPIFFLTWQVMHPINEASPLAGETAASLAAQRAEILVVMKGLDETFASTIHARASYAPHEIIWGRRLADIFTRLPNGGRAIDFRRFHDIV